MVASLHLQIISGFVFLLAAYLLKKLEAKRGREPLPPGPKGLPILGNILQWPKEAGWKTFAEWRRTYGDIVYCNLAGDPWVVLNSPQAAQDLFEKKGSIYCDRPYMTMSSELVGWRETLLDIAPYDERTRELRRLITKQLGSKTNLGGYADLLQTQVQRFLRRVLDDPESERLGTHIRTTIAAVILDIAYGYEVQEKDDPLIRLADGTLKELVQVLTPGAYLVDSLPLLRHIPDWLPGAGFKRVAARMRRHREELVDTPFLRVKEQLAHGTAKPSFTASLLEQPGVTSADEDFIKAAASIIYTGGSDTTIPNAHSFFLAMTLHPSAQATAQAELDRVVGPDRLPTLADRPMLPYVDALAREVLRRYPAIPQGLPHVSREEDVYAGFRIPKGANVIANIWRFCRDPATYADPLAFKPERFLGPTPERDPRDFVFGFGRRVCPGINLADSWVFLAVAMSLATLSISPATDADGNAIIPKEEHTTGVISYPKPFPCSIKPRSSKAEALVRALD
ncbi:cytochrome P450 [Punctularia strigosozonata HHB-11173 SS5]|uniref:Cytochrome P450 n=1 Tax=Punctularia strigosozonata (strain HHB-11173) TaxID=741275 RepID=R7S0Q4_PUNST|nr:cytochrome P450 [Punctularia strigosozonata HHB-11173 SS5]EIN03788.1 cytochrome P450 [Punctularia strigosozonata HHB-11173 SS5]